MKKPFRTLLLTAVTLCCLWGGCLARAEGAPDAVPAPKTEKVVTELSGLPNFLRDLKGITTSFCCPLDLEEADRKSPAQAFGAAPEEGAAAVVRLYVRSDDTSADRLSFSGHAFLTVTNVSDDMLEVGGLNIAPGTAITIGTRGNREEHTGIWYNLEGYYTYYIPDFYQNLCSIQVSLDAAQLEIFNRNLTRADKWSALTNCADFAAAMWNAVCADTLSAGCIPQPTVLRLDLLEKYPELAVQDPAVPYDYIVYYGLPAAPSQVYT